MGELLDSWKALIETAQEKDWEPPTLHEEGDLDHLRSIKAHPDLIAAAEHCFGLDDFYLAPTQSKRDYTPEFFFKNSLVIGDTGDGNFFLMVDAWKIDSRIVYADHDLATVTVVAESIVEFFKALARGYDSPDFVELKESCLDGFFEEFEASVAQKSDEDLGLNHLSDEAFDYFDISNASLGAEIDLKFRGKYTKIEDGQESGVLILTTESDEVIARLKRNDRVSFLVFLSVFAGVIWLFYNFGDFGGAGSKCSK